jgi:predicted thioredoxin/glutaredoxin
MEEMIRKNFPFVNLKVHRASECTDGSCCKLAQSYGIRCVPTLVIDGKIVLEGIVDESELKSKLSLSL